MVTTCGPGKGRPIVSPPTRILIRRGASKFASTPIDWSFAGEIESAQENPDRTEIRTSKPVYHRKPNRAENKNEP